MQRIATSLVRGMTLAAAGTLCWAAVASTAFCQDDLEPIQVGTPERIEVYPPQVKLTGPRQRVQLVVTGHYAGGALQDLTRVAEYASSSEAIANTDGSYLIPTGDGSAEISVKVGGQEAKVAVEVSGQTQPEPVSFEYGTGRSGKPCADNVTDNGGGITTSPPRYFLERSKIYIF